jgi:hypothetical protein
MRADAFLTNCRLADGRIADIGIAGGKIAAVARDGAFISTPITVAGAAWPSISPCIPSCPARQDAGRRRVWARSGA